MGGGGVERKNANTCVLITGILMKMISYQQCVCLLVFAVSLLGLSHPPTFSIWMC